MSSLQSPSTEFPFRRAYAALRYIGAILATIALVDLAIRATLLGDWNAGIAACQKALTLSPNLQIAKNNLGWAMQMNDPLRRNREKK